MHTIERYSHIIKKINHTGLIPFWTLNTTLADVWNSFFSYSVIRIRTIFVIPCSPTLQGRDKNISWQTSWWPWKKKRYPFGQFVSAYSFRSKETVEEASRILVGKIEFLYTWIKVETGITLCELLRIARTMSAAASPIVVLVYPFKHLTVGPLKPREERKNPSRYL